MSRFNPFKTQAQRAKLSTENQVEDRSRQVQALETHVQAQNQTLAQMGGTTAPTIKPTASPSVTALQNHVKNQASGSSAAAPPS